MALLTDEQRKAVWTKFMRFLSNNNEKLDIDKPELRAAINAIDQELNATQAAQKAAVPEPARTALTNKQIVGLYLAVIEARHEVT